MDISEESTIYSDISSAIRDGQFEVCNLLLTHGEDPNTPNEEGKIPLCLAVEKRNKKLVELLLAHNALINKKSEDGMSPIFLAAAMGYEEIFMLLLKYKPEIDVQEVFDNKTILDFAVGHNCFTIIEYILKHHNVVKENHPYLLKSALAKRCDYNIVELLSDQGFCTNFSSSDAENKDIVKFVVEIRFSKIFADLLKVNIDVNMVIDSYKKFSILHSAVENEDGDITESLISNGADVNALDAEEMTPLFYAVKNYDMGIIRQLLPKVDMKINCEAFNFAVWNGHEEILNVFLEHGYDINTRNRGGWVALHYTGVIQGTFYEDPADCPSEMDECKRGEMVAFLLNKGLDIDVETDDGSTTFLMSVENDANETVKALIPYHPDLNRIITNVSSSGRHSYREFRSNSSDDKLPKRYCNYLHLAVAKDNWKIVEHLLKGGANIDCRNEKGLTPLHLAVLTPDFRIVQTLIKNGANLNAKAKNGMTPLHLSALRKKGASFKLLIESGACINITDDYKRTLSDYMKCKPRGMKGMHSKLCKGFLKIYNSGEEPDSDDENYSSDILDYFPESRDLMSFDFQRDIQEAFPAHLMKLKIAKMFLRDEFQNVPLDPNFDRRKPDFEEDCEYEIDSMKRDKLEGSALTVYNILTLPTTKLTSLMREKQHFVSDKKAGPWRRKYPIYITMLRMNLLRAKRRRKQWIQLEKDCKKKFPLYFNLPVLCKELIFRYWC